MFIKTLVGVAAALGLAPVATAATPAPFTSPPPAHVRQMHWVRWDPMARSAQLRESRFGSRVVIGLESMRELAPLRMRYGLRGVHAMPQLRAAEVGIGRAALRDLLAAAPIDSRVRYVSPMGPTRHALSMPNDPLLSTIDSSSALPYEWQFKVSHVDRALDYTQGSSSIVVGTIDTGLGDVPDLAGKVNSRWNISMDGTLTPVASQEGNDDVGHGTAVASLIAANIGDGFGMAGFGGASHVVAVRAEDHGFSEAAVAVALMKLDSLGVRIVNMSFGGQEPDGALLLDAIHKASADGMLLIASTGNERSFVSYPAADLQPAGGARSYGLAVGASDMDGKLALFSNSGRHLSLLAPGSYSGPCSGVLVAMTPVSAFDESCYQMWAGTGGSRYAYIAGTSFAAPEVAGIAALVWAARPGLKNYQVADIIKQSAYRDAGSGWTAEKGCGVLDAGAALELATSRSASAWAAQPQSAGRACSAVAGGAVAWPDRNPVPTVRALPDSGHWGDPLSLRYQVDEDTREAATAINVRRNGTIVARLSSRIATVEPRTIYGLQWRAPRNPRRGDYSFCVRLTTRLGKRSAPSCAPISLR